MKRSVKQFVGILLCAAFLVVGLQISSVSAANTGLTTAPTTTAPVAASKALAIGEKVNLNMATLEQLDKIPGVGPATAKSIIQYRTTNGNFKSFDDLLKVKGIGPKNIEKIKPFLTF